MVDFRGSRGGIFLLALVACTAHKGDSSPVDTAPMDTHTGETAAPDTADSGESGESGDTGPLPDACSAGWGAIQDATTALNVSAEAGDDDASGAEDAPLATIAEALRRAASEGGNREIAVWRGQYPEVVRIGPNSSADLVFDGIRLHGCGAETVIVSPDETLSTVLVSEATGVEVAGLGIEGGRRALRVTAGAEAYVGDVDVEGGTTVSILIDGHDDVQLVNVHIAATAPDSAEGDDAPGIGLLLDGAVTAHLQTVTVEGSVGVGVLVNGSDAVVQLDDLHVFDTTPTAAGTLGRGIQVQNGAVASIRNAEVARCADAGIFAILAVDLHVEDSTVSDVAPSLTTSGAMAGDGIVLTSNTGAGDLNPASFPATLSRNTVTGWQSGAGRAGIYAEGVALTADENTADSGDGTASFVTDNPKYISGADASGFTTGVLDLTRTLADTTPFLAD